MTDHRDFEEPFAAPDHTDEEKSTRWILIITFAILILAGLAFASIGTLGRPTSNALFSGDDRQPLPEVTMITPAPGGTSRVE